MANGSRCPAVRLQLSGSRHLSLQLPSECSLQSITVNAKIKNERVRDNIIQSVQTQRST